jgi:Mg2+ and Co2+ transporter CorA
LISIFVHRNGQTEQASSLDRAWLKPASTAFVWVDLAAPSIPESLLLSETFKFHPLSVEDAMSGTQYPKAEAYDGYLYVILHGIDFRAAEKGQAFATHDVDFFLGPNYLVTVHDGSSRSPSCAITACATRGCSATAPSCCSTASSTRWSITTRRKWRSSKIGSTRSNRRSSNRRTALWRRGF